MAIFKRRRVKNRQRVRLRSGKVAHINGNFIADCQIFDRSESGARLRLGQFFDLPEKIQLFDDEHQVLRIGEIIWRKENEIGILFDDGEDNKVTCGEIHARLSGKYYSIDGS